MCFYSFIMQNVWLTLPSSHPLSKEIHAHNVHNGGGGGDILLMFIGSTVLREALVHKSEQKKTMFHNLQYGLRKQGLNNICSISEYNLRGMILIQINV